MARLVLLVLLFGLPSLSWSQDIITTPEGYRITPYAKHMGSFLAFEGRCEGGPACRDLQLIGCLENNKGYRHCLAAQVEGAGTAGRLFASDKVSVSPNKSGWRVVSVSSRCLQP